MAAHGTLQAPRHAGAAPLMSSVVRIALSARDSRYPLQTLEDLDLAFPRVSDAKKAELEEVRRILLTEDA